MAGPVQRQPRPARRGLTTLLDRGKAAGELRDDIDAADVILLLGALSRVPGAEWDARAHTLVAVIIDGLRRR